MESNITKEVIFSYFAGTCTAFQKNLIEAWTREDENRELFFDWLYEWEKMNVQYQVDVEAGLEHHRAWVKSLGGAVDEKPVFKAEEAGPFRFRWLLAAASALLICLFAAWFAKDAIRYRTYQTAYGEIEKITLPDGSKVVLNANSVFRVPRFGFGDDTRKVFLTGEASFNVVHTRDNMHFLVQTDKHINVEVLGTEFNVYSRPSGSRIVLNTGKIQLHYAEGNKREEIMMKPGDLATMDKTGKVVIAHTAQPQNFSAWKYHRFVFEDLPFREICDRLEETFGNRIIIEDQALSDQVISGSFTALDAEELLEILSEAGNFHYTTKGLQITLTTNGLTDTAPDSLGK